MSTLKVNTIQNTSGVEVYTAKAWVNFNGTGTVAIRASGNVSSITDNGTGNYTMNFTTAMPDANYSTTAMCRGVAGVTQGCVATIWSGSQTTTAVNFITLQQNTSATVDSDVVNLAIFR